MQILHFCITNYSIIFEYLALFEYISQHKLYSLFDLVNFPMANNIRYSIWSKINIRLNTGVDPHTVLWPTEWAVWFGGLGSPGSAGVVYLPPILKK